MGQISGYPIATPSDDTDDVALGNKDIGGGSVQTRRYRWSSVADYVVQVREYDQSFTTDTIENIIELLYSVDQSNTSEISSHQLLLQAVLAYDTGTTIGSSQNYPAAQLHDSFRITADGVVLGGTGPTCYTGDVLLAIHVSGGGTHGAEGANFIVLAGTHHVDQAIAVHVAAVDPHGDRAYAAALVDDLSGVTNASAARTALGLGTAATAASTDFDAAGVAAALVDDLSGVTNAPVARNNLGLGTAAVHPATDFDAAGVAAALVDDLSGVTNAPAARTNLGLGTAAVAATSDFDAAGVAAGLVDDLWGVTDATTARTNLGLDTFFQQHIDKQLVAWATRAMLPRSTYSNGSSGVGATLTATANGAVTIDGHAVSSTDVSAGTRFLIKDQVVNGTATAGGAATMTLNANQAPATDNILNGMLVTITAGTGAGQTRTVSGYVASTRVVTVSVNWTTPPDATSVYTIGGEQNGIYTCTQLGDGSHPFIFTRAGAKNAIGSEFDTASVVTGAVVYVLNGANAYNANSAWMMQGAGPFTIGTTSMQFIQVTQPNVWGWALQVNVQAITTDTWTGVTWDSIAFDNGGIFTLNSAHMFVPAHTMVDVRGYPMMGVCRYGKVASRLTGGGIEVQRCDQAALGLSSQALPISGIPGGASKDITDSQIEVWQDTGASVNTASLGQVMVFQMQPLDV
jgi:hypothetical protein